MKPVLALRAWERSATLGKVYAKLRSHLCLASAVYPIFLEYTVFSQKGKINCTSIEIKVKIFKTHVFKSGCLIQKIKFCNCSGDGAYRWVALSCSNAWYRIASACFGVTSSGLTWASICRTGSVGGAKRGSWEGCCRLFFRPAAILGCP